MITWEDKTSHEEFSLLGWSVGKSLGALCPTKAIYLHKVLPLIPPPPRAMTVFLAFHSA